MNKIGSAVIATAAVSSALLWGGQFGPQKPWTALWYGFLRKPSFTPPGPAIGAAWTILGALAAFTGYRLMVAAPSAERREALTCWSLSVAGIALYPWVFFGRKMLAASSGVVVLMFGSAAATVAAARKVDRPAMLAATPLVAWVGFAGLLSEELWRKNQ